MIRPSWSFADVLALNALQNSMILTPCGPSAVPTGGAGVAFPAGICSFTEPVIFFAITENLPENRDQHSQGVALGIDFVHFALEIGEGPVDNAHHLALFECHLWPWALGCRR